MALASAMNMSGLAASRPAAAIAGRLYFATDTGVLSYDNGSVWTTIPTGVITSASAVLGADVSMPTINTFYDLVTASLVAGTYILLAVGTGYQASFATDFVAAIRDGSNAVQASDMVSTPRAAVTCSVTVMARVAPIVTTTYKLSLMGNNSTCTAKAAVTPNGQGNNASYLIYIQVV